MSREKFNISDTIQINSTDKRITICPTSRMWLPIINLYRLLKQLIYGKLLLREREVFSMLHYWYLWGFLAVVMFILEVFHPVFIFAVLGISAIAALAASFFASVETQMIIFVVANLVVFSTVRPFIVRHLYRKSSRRIKTNIEAMIGKNGTVEETIGPNLKPGRVKVGDESWIGISWDARMIEKGETVEIVKIEGTKLYVRRKA